jgi:hypothetical protein
VHHSKNTLAMSGLGQQRRFGPVRRPSGLPSIADILLHFRESPVLAIHF